MTRFVVRCGNRAVKFTREVEAPSKEEALRIAREEIEQEIDDDILFDDVRVYSAKRVALDRAAGKLLQMAF